MEAFKTSKSFPYKVANLETVAREVATHFEMQGYSVPNDTSISGGWYFSLSKGGESDQTERRSHDWRAGYRGRHAFLPGMRFSGGSIRRILRGLRHDPGGRLK